MKLPFAITEKEVALAVAKTISAHAEASTIEVLGKTIRTERLVCPVLGQLRRNFHLPWNVAVIDRVHRAVRSDLRNSLTICTRVGLYNITRMYDRKFGRYPSSNWEKSDFVCDYLDYVHVSTHTPLHRAAYQTIFEMLQTYDEQRARGRRSFYEMYNISETRLRVLWMNELGKQYGE